MLLSRLNVCVKPHNLYSNVEEESLLLTDICELYRQKVLDSFETRILPIRELLLLSKFPKIKMQKKNYY